MNACRRCDGKGKIPWDRCLHDPACTQPCGDCKGTGRDDSITVALSAELAPEWNALKEPPTDWLAVVAMNFPQIVFVLLVGLLLIALALECR